MAQVVYTKIDHLGELDNARWNAGDQNSYAATQRIANSYDGISIIGREDKNGSVQPCYAKSNNETDWREVNAWHMTLAKFLFKKLDEAPAGKVLKPFFEEIDDQTTARALVQLVAARCGIDGAADEVRDAINVVGYDLRALGLPYGDWAYLPMRAAFEASDDRRSIRRPG